MPLRSDEYRGQNRGIIKLLVTENAYESSKCVQNTLERLDPQFTKYQFKLNVKQLMCKI